jgi:hypothetical protein
LSNVQKKHKLKYNSTLNQGFVLPKADVTARVFLPSKKGLFFPDFQNNVAYVLVDKVDKNKTKHTFKEYSEAVLARSLQDIIGITQ